MALVEITADSEEGFADLRLTLSDLRRDQEGVQHLIARGLHKGHIVAFAVSLGSIWNPQKLEGTSDVFYWGEAHLMSVGKESDAFIQALDEIYGTKIGCATMESQVGFTAASLEGDPLLLQYEPVKMKLFFEDDDDNRYDDRYAEFYLNINTTTSSVEFHEKDSEYRRAVVLCIASSTV